MTNHLYDRDFDGPPYALDAKGGIKLGGSKAEIAGKSSPHGATVVRTTFGAWVERASLLDMVDVGLAAGALVTVPLALILYFALLAAPGPAKPTEGRGVARSLAVVPPMRTPPPPRPVAPVAVAPVAVAPAVPPIAPDVADVAPERDAGAAWEGHTDEAPIAVVEVPPPVVGMSAVMEGIRRTAGSTSWQVSGRVDPLLAWSLDAILGEIRRATDDPQREPPVRFGAVPPGLGDDPQGVIHVAISPALFDRSVLHPAPIVLDAGRAAGSILIADGDIELTSAEDCVILATGAVKAAYTTRCLIIAGRSIRASYDEASVLISGSRLSVSHSGASARPPSRPAIYSAPKSVAVSHAAGVVFLNSGRLEVSHQDRCRTLAWPALDFGDVDRAAAVPAALRRSAPGAEAEAGDRRIGRGRRAGSGDGWGR